MFVVCIYVYKFCCFFLTNFEHFISLISLQASRPRLLYLTLDMYNVVTLCSDKSLFIIISVQLLIPKSQFKWHMFQDICITCFLNY